MPDESLPDKARRLLRGLGGTADEIAARLHALGVKGRPHRCRECPVAVFLRREGLPAMVDCLGVYPLDGSAPFRPAPGDAWPDFISRFDFGGYPHLVAAEPRPVAEPAEGGA